MQDQVEKIRMWLQQSESISQKGGAILDKIEREEK